MLTEKDTPVKILPYRYEFLERLVLIRNSCADLYGCINRQEELAKGGKQPMPEEAGLYDIEGKLHEGYIIWIKKTPEWYANDEKTRKKVLVRIGDYNRGFKTITVIAE